MKRKNWLRFVESCAFVALLCCVLAAVSHLVERKASDNQFGPFLDKPQEYDVLFFGDSRFVNSMFPMELWADYGIAGYNLSCYGNTMPISYWSMMNALDYASPKLVVLAVNGVRKDIKVTGSSSDLHTALDFFPLSRTKVRAVEDLMDDPEVMDDDGNRYADMKWEYYFALGKYHDRWSKLTREDFAAAPGVQKGAEMVVGVAEGEEYDIIDDDMFAEEQGCGYSYLRRTIEECLGRGIEVLLVHLPYPASEDSQMNANTVGSIAEEYGVNYIDFVRMDSVVDYAVDCYDQQSHLNSSGGQKVTAYLGQYIADHYDVEDRRRDADYAHWQAAYDDYAAYKREQIAAQDTLENLLMLLHDERFSVGIAIKEQADLYWDDKALTLLHNIAREHVFEADAYSKWSNSMFPLVGLEDAVWADEAYFLELDRSSGAICEYVGSDANARIENAFGAWEDGKEIQIRVTDSVTGETVAYRQF